MTSFFENQTLRKTLKFISNTDDQKHVSISISVNTNHEINKNIISDIENNINSMFLSNYMKEEEYERIKNQEKLNEKMRKENEKLQNKLRIQQEKNQREESKKAENNKPKQKGIRHLSDF